MTADAREEALEAQPNSEQQTRPPAPRRRRRRRRRPVGGAEKGEHSERGGNRNNARNRSNGRMGDRRPRNRRHRTGGTRLAEPTGPPIEVEGVLEIVPAGSGFLRSAENSYFPSPEDTYVPKEIVEGFALREADTIVGIAREGGRGPVLQEVHSVSGGDPEEMKRRPMFNDLTPIDPVERLYMETTGDNITGRIMDLIAPIGKGQRGLIVSPPKAGKTTILKCIANAIAVNDPEVTLIVLLVDERPEEVTDMQRSVRGEVVHSSNDMPVRNHIRVAKVTQERAKRMVEAGRDVVILMDSLTRLSRAHNVDIAGGGKIMSGGIDARAMQQPKKFFGSARNVEEGGSLTIIATALIETGSRMDEVIFQEFKGTGNWELELSREIADRRIFPAININKSGTRKEEKLLGPMERIPVQLLRRGLSPLPPAQAMEMLIQKMMSFPNNAKFLNSLQSQ